MSHVFIILLFPHRSLVKTATVLISQKSFYAGLLVGHGSVVFTRLWASPGQAASRLFPQHLLPCLEGGMHLIQVCYRMDGGHMGVAEAKGPARGLGADKRRSPASQPHALPTLPRDSFLGQHGQALVLRDLIKHESRCAVKVFCRRGSHPQSADFKSRGLPEICNVGGPPPISCRP